MAKLSDLPNELLSSIFYYCADLETAENLSSINRAMHNVWLNLSPASVITMFSRWTPAFKYAEKLAIAQTKQDFPELALDDQSITSGSPNAAFDLIRANLSKHIKLADSTFFLLTNTPYKAYDKYVGFVVSAKHWFKAYYLLCETTLGQTRHKTYAHSTFYQTEWADIQDMYRIVDDLEDVLLALSREYSKQPSYKWIKEVPIRKYSSAWSTVFKRLKFEYKSRTGMRCLQTRPKEWHN